MVEVYFLQGAEEVVNLQLSMYRQGRYHYVVVEPVEVVDLIARVRLRVMQEEEGATVGQAPSSCW